MTSPVGASRACASRLSSNGLSRRSVTTGRGANGSKKLVKKRTIPHPGNRGGGHSQESAALRRAWRRPQAACCRYRWPCESSLRGASVRLGSALAAWSSSEALARASARARLPRRRARCQSRPSIPHRKVRDCVQHPGSQCAIGATWPGVRLHSLPLPPHVAHVLHVHHAEHHVRD